jgi:predicted membrane-bound dolichyl-phosphate-mannose-protein mannosyltransferase
VSVESPSGRPTAPSPSEPQVEARAGRRGSSFRAFAAGAAGNLRDPGTALPLLLIAALAVRAVWLELPRGSLIFDESYYVNAARILLGWVVPPGASYADSPAGLDPNSEHPPLGKLLIAGSMLLFGDNGIAWRLPSLISGLGALGALYLIVRAAGETAWLAILAVAILAFDNLTFVHGRIGTLDMMVLAPMLVAAWLALRERWGLAGIVLGIGLLVKLTALYGLLALLLLIGLRLLGELRATRRIALASLRPGIVLVGAFSVVALGGLWLLDSQFSTFTSPFDHLRRIVEYGANLRGPVVQTGICPGADSGPMQWLFNQCQITYLRVDVTVRAGEEVVSSVPSIDFRGALNPLLPNAMLIATLFVGWRAWLTGNVLARWSTVWIAANYLPYVAIALVSNRIMYIYYFLPVVPGVAVALAILLLRGRLPRIVTWGYVLAYALGFLAYFPFRQIP